MIDHFSAILNEAIPATLKEIQQQTDDAVDSSEKFIAVLDTMTTLSQNQLSKDATKHKIQESMIGFRQLELYLNILSNDVRQSAREVEELLSQFKARLDQLKTTIQNKTAYVVSLMNYDDIICLLFQSTDSSSLSTIYALSFIMVWFSR